MKTITNTVGQYVLILLLVCVGAMTAQAATYTVTNNVDSGAGSLREAIAQANASIGSDTIGLSSSLDGQTITLTSGELAVAAGGDSLTINGNGAANTIISGNNAVRPLAVSGANVTLSGLTITYGNVPSEFGGAIINYGTLTVTRRNIIFYYPINLSHPGEFE